MTTGPTPVPGDARPSGASAPSRVPPEAAGPPMNHDATASIGDAAAAATPPPPPRADPAASTTGDLVRNLTDTVRTLVRGEVANAQQEMTEKALAARPAGAMLGGAAVLGVLAVGTSAVVVVRFLDRIFPPTVSAVVATGLLGGGAAALARAGVAELRRVGPPVPERTIESVKADVAAVTDAAPGGRS